LSHAPGEGRLLVADAGNWLAVRERNLGSTDDHATVIGRVAQDNEWSLTHEILCIYFAANLAWRAAKGAVAARSAVCLQTPLAGSDHAAIADALSTLESKLSGLISLSADERRSLNKMGEKSETFCRRTLVAMSENPGLIPADVGRGRSAARHGPVRRAAPAHCQADQLLGRAKDSEMALGSDAMVTALEGYALLKVLGKGSGLDALRKDMSVRFTRKARAMESPAQAA